MKKLISVAAAALCGAMVFAQDTIPSKMNPANSPSLNKPMRSGMDTMPGSKKWNNSDTSRMNPGNKLPDSTSIKNNRNRSKPDSTGTSLNNPMNNNGNDSSLATTGNLPDSSMSNNTANNGNSATMSDSSKSSSITNNNSATANNSTSKNNSSMSSNASDAKEKEMIDRVIMKNGQMMMVKSGDTTAMAQSVTLSSGAVVMKDGIVKYKSGKTIQLKDGQFINLGKIDEDKAKKTSATSGSTTKTKTVTTIQKKKSN